MTTGGVRDVVKDTQAEVGRPAIAGIGCLM